MCHDKVVDQQFAVCSGSPHDDNPLTSYLTYAASLVVEVPKHSGSSLTVCVLEQKEYMPHQGSSFPIQPFPLWYLCIFQYIATSQSMNTLEKLTLELSTRTTMLHKNTTYQ